MSPEQSATARGESVLRALVEKGADLNLPDGRGRTALHLAAAANAPVTLMDWMISKGGDPLRKDADGRSVVDYASGSDLRLALEERFVFPVLSYSVVHGFYRVGDQREDQPLVFEAPTEWAAAPSWPDLLKEAQNRWHMQLPDRFAVAIYRGGPNGKRKQAMEVVIEAGKTAAPLPTLQWGDVFIIRSVPGDSGSTSGRSSNDFRYLARANPTSITLRVGDEVSSHKLVYPPETWAYENTVDLPGHGVLTLCWQISLANPRADLRRVKIRRGQGAAAREWLVDASREARDKMPDAIAARAGESHVVVMAEPRIMDGDEIEIPLVPLTDAEATKARRDRITFSAPNRTFGAWFAARAESEATARTLGEAIVAAYMTSGLVVPNPDLAHIRVHRMKGDTLEDETLEFDLATPIASDLTEGAAKTFDVPLQWGDIVEIRPKGESEGTPWTGLDKKTQIFLQKALVRTIKIVENGTASGTRRMLPAFRQIERSEDGSWETRGSWVQSFTSHSFVEKDDRMVQVQLKSGERVRTYTPSEFLYGNVWLVDGDEVWIDRK